MPLWTRRPPLLCRHWRREWRKRSSIWNGASCCFFLFFVLVSYSYFLLCFILLLCLHSSVNFVCNLMPPPFYVSNVALFACSADNSKGVFSTVCSTPSRFCCVLCTHSLSAFPCMSLCLSVSLSLCLSVSLSLCLSVSLSLCLSVSLSLCHSVSVSACRTLCLYVSVSLHLCALSALRRRTHAAHQQYEALAAELAMLEQMYEQANLLHVSMLPDGEALEAVNEVRASLTHVAAARQHPRTAHGPCHLSGRKATRGVCMLHTSPRLPHPRASQFSHKLSQCRFSLHHTVVPVCLRCP